MNPLPRFSVLLAISLICDLALAEPRVDSTELIGSFSGHDAALHPDNLSPVPIEYYGTDLGFTYEHRGTLHILFGDTWATEAYAPIESSTGARFDDGFGTIDLALWPDPGLIAPDNIPLIKLGQHVGSGEMSAIDPGHAMDLGHTPMAGFSNGKDQFAIFNLTKPQACRQDTDCDNGLTCDAGLGYFGVPSDEETGLTLPCVDGMAFCEAQAWSKDSEAPSGFCIDTSSTIYADTPSGRVSASGLRVLVGKRSVDEPRKYPNTRNWLTNKFANVTARTAAGLDPVIAEPVVLLWGRPGFIGVGANERSLGLYFAYTSMPRGESYEWQVRYYTGQEGGAPQFSTDESEAMPLDLDADTPGVQSTELNDIVHQMSVSWVEPLNKWVMLYGGGITSLPSPPLPNCGVLELFARFECKAVDVGNGAIRMRTADQPWGPWSPPQDVLVGGEAAAPGSGQYGPGGVLHHPSCSGDSCAAHTETAHYHDDEYGFLYSANIIEQWTREVPGGVEILWNASTWDPYRVVLFRTTIMQ